MLFQLCTSLGAFAVFDLKKIINTLLKISFFVIAVKLRLQYGLYRSGCSDSTPFKRFERSGRHLRVCVIK